MMFHFFFFIFSCNSADDVPNVFTWGSFDIDSFEKNTNGFLGMFVCLSFSLRWNDVSGQ